MGAERETLQPSFSGVASGSGQEKASSFGSSLDTSSSSLGRTVSSNKATACLAPKGPSDSVPATDAFVHRNGRTYLADASVPYPLPVDLPELHRQSLRTLLLMQVNGGPVKCPALIAKPPRSVLEIGCGSGYWSAMCHRFFKSRGNLDISFTGMDIFPLAPGNLNTSDSTKPGSDMKWRFVQHNILQMPWPFEDEEFDLVMTQDMTLAINQGSHTRFGEEVLRVLKQGGVAEIWETDHTIRVLWPHVPSASVVGTTAEEHEAASQLGIYIINANTPLSTPLKPSVVEYNQWITRALEAHELVPNPCAIINYYLFQEAESLTDVHWHRVAIPFGEVHWEHEGVGGVVTSHGKPYGGMKGGWQPHREVEKRTLTTAQASLRRIALLTFVQELQALELLLCDASGKNQDEWDKWMDKMAADLMVENGASSGECLEMGVWWARKR